jgi:hypothetical protein
MSKIHFGRLIAPTLLLVLAASSAEAAVSLDLTAGGTGTINGAVFTTTDNSATGSGVIDSFVRISDNDDTVDGYNTSARPLQFDENTSATFTHDLPLSVVPIVTLSDGFTYREFLLDINQTKNEPLLNLLELQIFVGDTASLTGATVGAGGTLDFSGAGGTATLIYDLDAGGNDANTVQLNYNLNAGSGSGDLFVYIRDSLFTSVGANDFVTLYSLFEPNNDGFEEWAVRTTDPISPETPEPTSIIAWLVCTGGLGLVLRRRMKKTAV